MSQEDLDFFGPAFAPVNDYPLTLRRDAMNVRVDGNSFETWGEIVDNLDAYEDDVLDLSTDELAKRYAAYEVNFKRIDHSKKHNASIYKMVDERGNEDGLGAIDNFAIKFADESILIVSGHECKGCTMRNCEARFKGFDYDVIVDLESGEFETEYN